MSAASGIHEAAPEPGNMFTAIKNYFVAVGLLTSIQSYSGVVHITYALS
jgi:hypothetical protein